MEAKSRDEIKVGHQDQEKRKVVVEGRVKVEVYGRSQVEVTKVEVEEEKDVSENVYDAIISDATVTSTRINKLKTI